jgi:hypothetical protein
MALLALCWAGEAGAQPAPASAKPTAGAPGASLGLGEPSDGGVVQAGCSTCSRGLFAGRHSHGDQGLCAGCNYGPCNGCCAGCGGPCVPGRTHCCSCCEGKTFVGRCLCGLYECICCPDPCYEPRWVAAANAAFFVDGARPVTHMRIRWDSGLNFTFPDRSEFFWARIGGKGPRLAETAVRYNDLSLYTETAIGTAASFFVEIPYRSLDPEVNNHSSGFGDMNLGTKAVLFDCELIQITFQFRTYLPVGNFTRGLGTGNVALEPSLLTAIKLNHDTYFQGQLSEWIPLGGDADYAGALLHYHASLNHVLWRVLPDVPLIGTLEFNGYSFQDGSFTDPILGPFQRSSGDTYFSAGPGLRLVICDKVDFGVGTAFAIGDHGPDQVYRTEFRWRF